MNIWRIFSILLFFSEHVTAQNEPYQDTLIVGYTAAAPFIVDNEGSLSGVSIWLWEKIAANYATPYRYQQINFATMARQLENEEIDICINPLKSVCCDLLAAI